MTPLAERLVVCTPKKNAYTVGSARIFVRGKLSDVPNPSSSACRSGFRRRHATCPCTGAEPRRLRVVRSAGRSQLDFRSAHIRSKRERVRATLSPMRGGGGTWPPKTRTLRGVIGGGSGTKINNVSVSQENVQQASSRTHQSVGFEVALACLKAQATRSILLLASSPSRCCGDPPWACPMGRCALAPFRRAPGAPPLADRLGRQPASRLAQRSRSKISAAVPHGVPSLSSVSTRLR